ncbi:unnamed protein product [Rhizoctonia solani]|uniref:Zn(2)-C6 fungal-type domain-containing protein n=1 Tax=Rhizoctonia solani TaxID=456999 RepID=A0A8H3DQS9_9AGAM|nr:unnamed protein product [Rhizoctonia solani]
MQLHKSPYGPRGLSCLTCRQRRKKCDRTRPVCERCINGRFECLGYDSDPPDVPSTESQRTPTWIAERLDTTNPGSRPSPRGMPIQARSVKGQPVSVMVPSQIITSGLSAENSRATPLNDANAHLGLFDDSRNSILSTGALRFMSRSHSKSRGLPNTSDELEYFDQKWPQEQAQSLVQARTFDPGIGRSRSGVIQPSIPRAVNINAQMRESYFTFILSEYELHRLRKFFRPPPIPLGRGLTSRMKRSNTILGFMYLGAKVFETLTNKPKNAVSDCCKKWIANFDRQVTDHPPSNPSIRESEDRLTGLLELVYLTFLVVDAVAGYALLKRALPLFLHLVSNDPELWSERGGQLAISLPRVLSTLRYEIRRFVFYDIMCALVLGVAPLAEYDPGEPPTVSYPPLPMEMFHGIPVEWILIIGHVHAGTDGWRNLEIQTLSWHPRVVDIWGEESTEIVYRMAIQEAWRHATLIYIYMRMCGVDSHDRRVQTSVKQIARLMEVVRDSPMDVHFSIPCIIAGIAERCATQRALIYQKLLSFRNTHIWILRGADFAPILKHLWQGAGFNGDAVTWGDYVNSRCALLPLL